MRPKSSAPGGASLTVPLPGKVIPIKNGPQPFMDPRLI